MISIIPPVPMDGEDSDAEDDAGSVDSDFSAGGTMRRNCSVAQALSDQERLELLRWATRESGPWSDDLRDYPGPPVNATAAAAGGTSLEDSGLARGEEPYRPILSGYDCEVFRNEYLAWCAVVQLPEGHPDTGKKTFELSKELKVHGGISLADRAKRRPQFDCNHGLTDLVPYACFSRSAEQDRRVGALAPAVDKSGVAGPTGGAGGGLLVPGRPSAGPCGGGGGKLLLPQAPGAGPAPPRIHGGATYKDYKFVRRELEALAAQFRAHEDQVTSG